MIPLTAKRALVVGCDCSGNAASALLRARGVTVDQVDGGEAGARLAAGLGGTDLVVLSSGVAGAAPAWVAEVAARRVTVICERELAFQQSYCLHVAVTGSSGKRTTAELIAHLLRGSGRRVEVAAGAGRPACAFVEATRDIDLMIHAVAPEELEWFQYFRPVVGVLLNASEREESDEGDPVVARYSRLFSMQQAFDWAVIQSEAMARMEATAVKLPGKRITFSAVSRRADLGFERGLLVSRMEGWSGPLWDMSRGSLRGPHLAEDVLAALAVGRVLRLGLDDMTASLGGFQALPGRMENLGEAGGVRFVHDGASGHLDSLERALVTLAPTAPESPFIWLIAGGVDAGRHFYDLGPVLSPRVKQALVLGESAASMQAAWQLFTPCTLVTSLLDAANRAVEQAMPGDVILFSPGCPSRGTFPEPEAGTDAFREVFRARLDGLGGSEGTSAPHPLPPIRGGSADGTVPQSSVSPNPLGPGPG